MKQTNHTPESLGKEMTACNKLGLESVRQSLIEAMADFLDADDMVMNEAYGDFKDPVKREESELHIRMADAALNAYSDTVLPQFAQQQTDKLYTREEVVKIEKYEGIANLEFEMTSRIYQVWERRKALAREVLEGAPENKTLHITEEIKHLDALLKKIFLID